MITEDIVRSILIRGKDLKWLRGFDQLDDRDVIRLVGYPSRYAENMFLNKDGFYIKFPNSYKRLKLI